MDPRRSWRPRDRAPSTPRGHSRRLLTADGVRVWAEHLPGVAATRRDLAIVVVHGFTMSSAIPRVREIGDWLRADDEVGVVLVDLRGHGRSGGHSTLGWLEVLDVDAAVRWAFALGYRRVVTLGFSMGAAVVVRHGALFGGVAAVAAVSGPGQWYYRGSSAMRTLHRLVLTRPGRGALRLLRGTRVTRHGWTDPLPLDPVAAAELVGVPLLVVHGDRDDYFPTHHAWRVHAAAANSTLWLERGFGHAEAAMTPALAQRIGRWLAEQGGAQHLEAAAWQR